MQDPHPKTECFWPAIFVATAGLAGTSVDVPAWDVGAMSPGEKMRLYECMRASAAHGFAAGVRVQEELGDSGDADVVGLLMRIRDREITLAPTPSDVGIAGLGRAAHAGMMGSFISTDAQVARLVLDVIGRGTPGEEPRPQPSGG